MSGDITSEGTAGVWLAGWLFTLALMDLSFLWGVWAIVAWPWFLGNWVQGLFP